MYSLLPIFLSAINVTLSAQELNISASVQQQTQQVTVYLALKIENTVQPTSSELYKPGIKCYFQGKKSPKFVINDSPTKLNRTRYFNYEFRTNQNGMLQCDYKQNGTIIKSNVLEIPPKTSSEYRYLPKITFPINNNRKKDLKIIEKLIQPQFKVVDFGNDLFIATRLKYWPINYNDDWKNFNELNHIIDMKVKPRFEVTEVLSTKFCPEMEISSTIQIPYGEYKDQFGYRDKNGNEFFVYCLGNGLQGYQWNQTQIEAIKNHVEQQKIKLTTEQEFQETTTTIPEKSTDNEISASSHEPIESISSSSSNQMESTTDNVVQSKPEISTEIVRVSKSVTFPSEPTEDTMMTENTIDPYLNSFTNSEVQTRALVQNFATVTWSPEDEINEIWNSFHQLTTLHNNMSDIASIQNFATALTEVTRFNEKLLPPLATSLENIVSENKQILVELQRKNTSNQILESLDRLLLNVVDLGSDGFEEEVRSNIALRMEDLAITQGVGIALIAAADTELRDLTGPNTVQSLDRASNSESIRELSPLAAVRLPESVLRSSERALFTVQSNGHLFSTSSKTSAIVGAELSGGPYENLPEPVRIYFRRDQAQRPRRGECVSWDFSLNDGFGDWSTRGCKFHTTHYDANIQFNDDANRCEEPKLEGVVLDECWCYHLTHFGQLFLDHSLHENTDNVLDVISLVGVSISLVCLTAVLISTFAFPKLIQRPGQKTKIQITSNLAVLLLLFLIASQLPTGLPILARVILGIAIHYSMLCNFSCMLIAAIMQYRRLIVVFARDSVKLDRIYIVMAWVVPMVPPIVVLATGNYHAYCKPPLYLPQGLIFYLSLGLPLLLVLLCNVTVFVMIARSLYASIQIRIHSGDRQNSMVRFRQLVFLFMLLGLSWTFALCQIIVPESTVIVFSYLFCICIAIQGPAYFVFFVIMDQAAIKEWKKLLCSRFNKDIMSETTTSTSRTNDKHTNGKNQSKFTSETGI